MVIELIFSIIPFGEHIIILYGLWVTSCFSIPHINIPEFIDYNIFMVNAQGNI